MECLTAEAVCLDRTKGYSENARKQTVVPTVQATEEQNGQFIRLT